jgi:hypothetical protein
MEITAACGAARIPFLHQARTANGTRPSILLTLQKITTAYQPAAGFLVGRARQSASDGCRRARAAGMAASCGARFAGTPRRRKAHRPREWQAADKACGNGAKPQFHNPRTARAAKCKNSLPEDTRRCTEVSRIQGNHVAICRTSSREDTSRRARGALGGCRRARIAGMAAAPQLHEPQTT